MLLRKKIISYILIGTLLLGAGCASQQHEQQLKTETLPSSASVSDEAVSEDQPNETSEVDDSDSEDAGEVRDAVVIEQVKLEIDTPLPLADSSYVQCWFLSNSVILVRNDPYDTSEGDSTNFAVYDIETGQTLQTLTLSYDVYEPVKCTVYGDRLQVTAADRLYTYDLPSFALVEERPNWDFPGFFLGYATPDLRYYLTADFDVTDLEDGSVRNYKRPDQTSGAYISGGYAGDYDMLFLEGEDDEPRTLWLFNVETGEFRTLIEETDNKVLTIANGRAVLSSGSRTGWNALDKVTLLDAATGYVPVETELGNQGRYCLSQGGGTIGRMVPLKVEGLVYFISSCFETQELIAYFTCFDRYDTPLDKSVAVSPDGTRYVYVTDDYSVILADLRQEMPKGEAVEDPFGLVTDGGYCWQGSDAVGAVYTERYYFNYDGRYVYAESQYNAERMRYSTGEWWVEGDMLYLSATHLMTIVGGEEAENDPKYNDNNTYRKYYEYGGELKLIEIPEERRVVEDYAVTVGTDENGRDTRTIGKQQLWEVASYTPDLEYFLETREMPPMRY